MASDKKLTTKDKVKTERCPFTKGRHRFTQLVCVVKHQNDGLNIVQGCVCGHVVVKYKM